MRVVVAAGIVVAAGCGQFGFDAECAQPSLLTDDFDGDALSFQWLAWSEPGTSMTLGGGALELTPAVDATQVYAGIVSRQYFDLRGQRSFVEVVQATDPATTAQTFLQLLAPNDQRLEIIEEAGELLFRVHQDGDFIAIAGVPYDPAAHRFWQVRERDGTVYYEISADGVAFTTHASVATPFDVSLVRQQLGVGTWEPVAAPGAAVFDRHNGGGPPRGRWCDIGNLRDDFDDGVRDRRWLRAFGPPGCATESGGALVIEPPPELDSYCGYGSSQSYDLRGGTVRARLVTGTAADSRAHTLFELRDDRTGLRHQLIQQESELIARVPGEPDLAVLPYDPAAHRYLRYADRDDGDMAWQTSPDGVTWTTLYEGPAAVDVAAVSVLIAIAQFDTGAPPPPVRWDDVRP